MMSPGCKNGSRSSLTSGYRGRWVFRLVATSKSKAVTLDVVLALDYHEGLPLKFPVFLSTYRTIQVIQVIQGTRNAGCELVVEFISAQAHQPYQNEWGGSVFHVPPLERSWKHLPRLAMLSSGFLPLDLDEPNIAYIINMYTYIYILMLAS